MRRQPSALTDPLDAIPDVRDGLTRPQRIVLWVLGETQRERGGRSVPTAMLYGRVVEHIPLSVPQFQRVLQSLGAANHDLPRSIRAPDLGPGGAPPPLEPRQD